MKFTENEKRVRLRAYTRVKLIYIYAFPTVYDAILNERDVYELFLYREIKLGHVNVCLAVNNN